MGSALQGIESATRLKRQLVPDPSIDDDKYLDWLYLQAEAAEIELYDIRTREEMQIG